MPLIKVFICFLFALLPGLACTSGTGSEPVTVASSSPAPAVETTDGKAVYRQYCVACHGADGKLGLNGAGDLTKSALTLDERITQISKGKNLMTPFEEMLTPDEIKAVAAYTLKLKNQ